MKTTFGIVALLDAIGARTADMEGTIAYLHSLDAIRAEIEAAEAATLDDEEEKDETARALVTALRPRFFGDSILMTYPVPEEKDFTNLFWRMGFVLNCLVPAAMERGILFRGAVSVGSYVREQGRVVCAIRTLWRP